MAGIGTWWKLLVAAGAALQVYVHADWMLRVPAVPFDWNLVLMSLACFFVGFWLWRWDQRLRELTGRQNQLVTPGAVRDAVAAGWIATLGILIATGGVNLAGVPATGPRIPLFMPLWLAISGVLLAWNVRRRAKALVRPFARPRESAARRPPSGVATSCPDNQ